MNFTQTHGAYQVIVQKYRIFYDNKIRALYFDKLGTSLKEEEFELTIPLK